MLLGLIDFPGGGAAARALSFRRPESLAALDVVLWRPDAIADLYGAVTQPGGLMPLELLQAQELVIHTRAWREEFRAFLSRGGSLVVLAPATETLPLHTPQDIVAYDPLEALPEKVRVQREPMAASAVACGYGEPFRSLFAATADLFLAQSSLAQADSQAIAAVAERVCALYRFLHPGRLMVLPALAAEPDPVAAQRLIEAISATVQGLRRSAAQQGSAASALLPPTAREIALARELESVTAQRLHLEQTEFELRTRLGWLRELSTLLIEGDGEHLAVAAAALQSIGGSLLHEFDRADSVVIEAAGSSLLLMLAHPGESASDCRLRLDAFVRARCRETGRALQPVVLGLGEGHAGFDAPGPAPDASGATRWRFLRGHDLYAACADGGTGSLSRLLTR